ncbi:MAG: hypothetical protein ACOCSQ_06120, partial [Planctomycetota bacterium]
KGSTTNLRRTPEKGAPPGGRDLLAASIQQVTPYGEESGEERGSLNTYVLTAGALKTRGIYGLKGCDKFQSVAL